MKKWILSIAAFTLFWQFSLAQTSVDIVDFAFQPADITISEGTTVTWDNNSSSIHTSTSGSPCTADGQWNSGNLSPGESFSMTFEEGSAGTYSYFCIPHCGVGMTGTVTVDVSSATKDVGTAGAFPKVFPNPFTDRLHVETQSGIAGTMIVTMYDIQGNLLVRKEREAKPNLVEDFTIEGASLVPGTYVVKVSLEGRTWMRKVAKPH